MDVARPTADSRSAADSRPAAKPVPAALARRSAAAAPATGSLRIVLVSTQRGWHGGEEQARLLAVGLRQQGHVCRIAARGDSLFAARMEADGFHVDWLPAGLDIASWNALRRNLRRWQPHVLHFNDGHAVTRGGLGLLGLGACVRIAARRVDFRLRSGLPYRLLCDRVVCVSQAVAQVCRQSGLSEQQLRVVHDGVDPARIDGGDRQRGRRALGLTDQDTLLLTVAKLTDHKGHRFLLDALPEVLRRHPRIRVAWAGDGELTGVLRDQAQRLGIAGQVQQLGFRQDIPDLMQAADLFVLPSHMEGLCTSLIDAMLARRPIVATTAGGIPDLLQEPADGCGPLAWLAPPADSPALKNALLQALADPRERAARAARARQRAEREFLARHMVQSTLDVYREAWTERHRSPADRWQQAG